MRPALVRRRALTMDRRIRTRPQARTPPAPWRDTPGPTWPLVAAMLRNQRRELEERPPAPPAQQRLRFAWSPGRCWFRLAGRIHAAKLYSKKQKGRECLDYCNRLLERGYEPLVAVSLKARVLNYTGRFDMALNFLRPYIDHNPENDALWVVLSEIYEYRDDYGSALTALQNAKRLLQNGQCEHRAENLRFVVEKIKELSAMK